MSVRSIDITGQRFGSLVALERAGRSPGRAGMALWKCRCDCGTEKTYYSMVLRAGRTSSCGCKQSEAISRAMTKHGMTRSREFNTWKGMIARTTNPNDPFYETYGGRGIVVCERWKNSFEDFYADMGPRPPGKTLDREDNDKGYEPGNCRWATKEEQALNRRTTLRLHLGGEEVSRREAARRIGINVNALRRWMLMGLTPDEVMAKKKGALCV